MFLHHIKLYLLIFFSVLQCSATNSYKSFLLERGVGGSKKTKTVLGNEGQENSEGNVS